MLALGTSIQDCSRHAHRAAMATVRTSAPADNSPTRASCEDILGQGALTDICGPPGNGEVNVGKYRA
eukprot:8558449-Pyramimonas_sp.AAC.1